MPGREGERKVIGEGGDKGLEVKEGVERKDCHMFGTYCLVQWSNQISKLIGSQKLETKTV